MVRQGLVEEVGNLINMGYQPGLASMNSIGYKQIGMFIRQEITLERALELIKLDNHRFARHQYAWFKLKDKRINWFDIQNNIELKSQHSESLNNC
jgi:tRNA dimethylallyltransferase